MTLGARGEPGNDLPITLSDILKSLAQLERRLLVRQSAHVLISSERDC